MGEAANADEPLRAEMVLSVDRVCVRSSERGRERDVQVTRMASRPAMEMKRAIVRCETTEPEAWTDDAEIYGDHQRVARLACQGLTIPVYESTVLSMRATRLRRCRSSEQEGFLSHAGHGTTATDDPIPSTKNPLCPKCPLETL